MRHSVLLVRFFLYRTIGIITIRKFLQLNINYDIFFLKHYSERRVVTRTPILQDNVNRN